MKSGRYNYIQPSVVHSCVHMVLRNSNSKMSKHAITTEVGGVYADIFPFFQKNSLLLSVSHVYCKVFSPPFCAKLVSRKRHGRVYFLVVESGVCFLSAKILDFLTNQILFGSF